ncbi:LysR family transcriptional regulator [Parendozoicomonas haliclonae]|uniref:HTH-type transcriptional regulator DmlR n=1 Tax=Parendozoicomonas haliclonae TaxID=1960125 RepID=A0A1X7AN97_9GAMM|nr:LysR family transcriptional regulator [Parendozoicomonas haliclonae]SMA49774.1 HTH-type transcriptional regulator DmlR [Parendozoicomonas haliclonae]
MNRLRYMSSFAQIIESGSISAAADALNISKSVVSQHLKELESLLGLTLLKRTTRRQTLTPEGHSFYQHCKAVNETADTAWREAEEALTEPRGTVRITTSQALMDALVAPATASLLSQHPKLKPELISTDQPLDLIAHDIDLAIRVGRSPDSNLLQKRLGEFRDQLCASPSLISQGNIEQAPYIANTWQGKAIHHRFTSSDGQTVDYEAEAQCLADSFHTCRTLIEMGAGTGLIPEFIVKASQGKLADVFPDYQLPINTVYALSPFNKHMPLSVRVCLAAIEEKLAAQTQQ